MKKNPKKNGRNEYYYGVAAVLIALVLVFTSCPNPSTSLTPSRNDSETKDWATADIIDKLTASDGAARDFFGTSVAISGDSAIVGAYGDGLSSGSVYIFQQNAGVWSEAQKLTASDREISDNFGFSVAISGDTAIIGASSDGDNGSSSGSVYIFQQNAGVWSEAQKLTASDGAAYDKFGYSVAISGDTAIVGAHGDDDNGSSSGSVYIFQQNAGVWSEAQKLTASDGEVSDNFGISVAIFGDSTFVGAYGDEFYSGSVYIFQQNAGVWSEAQELTASDGAASDLFGYSVAISGDTAVIGASSDDDNGSSSGSAYIFQQNAGVWSETQKLTASDGAEFANFGISVAISGDTAVIGASSDDDNGSSSGSVYIFQQNAGVWGEAQKLTASDGAASDYFGSSVAISGDSAIVGAFSDDDNGSSSGSVYMIE